MSDKKSLSDKKLRRIIKKQNMKTEKSESIEDASIFQLPKEWTQPPKHLKGRKIGLWYKNKNDLMKQVQDLRSQMQKKFELSKCEGEVSVNEQSVGEKKKKKKSKVEKKKKLKIEEKEKQEEDRQIVKLTKTERRKLRLVEKQLEEEKNGLFKISFDPIREKMINDFFDSVKDKPPTFLLPHYEYHKRLMSRQNFIKKNDVDVNLSYTSTANVPFSDEVLNETLSRVTKLSDKIPFHLKKLPVKAIKEFLVSGMFGDSLSGIEEQRDVYHKARNEKCLSFEEVKCFIDSKDKYKHLEDTPFKLQFLSVLSGSIQSNLEKAVRFNSKWQPLYNMDLEIFKSFQAKKKKSSYKSMLAVRTRLPVFSKRDEILNLVRNNQVILISGETGCGKTTQVAQFILDKAIEKMCGSSCNIICTQPRRISAISVAQRVADERSEILGKDSIGYQIRLEKKIGRRRGSILFCTTGILLQYMQCDPALSKHSHIILDEIHERDIMCDFALTILKEVIAKRKDLKIVLMSATLNAEQFSRYFNDCPMINIPGYTHPVDEYYLEDVLEMTRFTFNKKKSAEMDSGFKEGVLPYVESLRQLKAYDDLVLDGLSNPESEKINTDLIVELVKQICEKSGPGAILVFVSGMDDINSVIKKMNLSDFFNSREYLIIPLHSMLPTANQKTVFERPPPGKRKIVISTNIAETSITIDDVVYVIDCGRIKIKNYDVHHNISTLKPEFVSLANARQRRGRAGRVQRGVCYHLFSRGREKVLDGYPLPEMLRTRLEEVILNIKILQLGKVKTFLQKVLDPPNPQTAYAALELLYQLNALDENENLTPLGFHLAKLPLDPQIGKMLLMGVTMSCLTPILTIAAMLSHKDPFYLPIGEEKLLNERKLAFDKGHKSDHLIMVEVMEQWERSEKDRRNKGKTFCEENFLVRGNLFQLRDLRVQFAQYLHEMGFLPSSDFRQKNLNMNSDNVAIVKAVICSGLYPNVAIIDPKSMARPKKKIHLKTCEDGAVFLHPKSVNNLQSETFQSCFLVYHQKLMSTNVNLHDTTMIPTLPLLIFCHDYYLTIGQRDQIIIELNKRIQFQCTPTVTDMIEELKLRLCWLLEYKLSHPGQITWGDSSGDIELLKLLTDLFTNENDILMSKDDESGS